MQRPAKLPDLSDVDITELKLMILAVLERHGMGPEWRRSMRGAQIGGMLDLCGGVRQVLAKALAAVRRRLRGTDTVLYPRHLYRNDLEPSAHAQFNSPVILSKLITTACP